VIAVSGLALVRLLGHDVYLLFNAKDSTPLFVLLELFVNVTLLLGSLYVFSEGTPF
jgi:hypothetical protein